MKKLILIVFMMLVFSIFVSATIYIEPQSIMISNAMSGVEYSKSITLRSDSEQNVLVTAKVSDSLKGIVTVEPEKRALGKDLSQNVQVKFKGEKAQGHISFCFDSQSVSMISTEGEKCVGIKLEIDSVDEKFSQVNVNNVKIHDSDTKKGLDLEIEVDNTGNADETLIILVSGNSYEISSKAFNKEKKHIRIANNLGLGAHALHVIVKHNSAEIYSKDVQVQIKDMVLEHVDAYVEPIQDSVINDTIQIYTMLNSIGSGTECTLKVDVSKDGNLVRHFEESGFIGTGEVKEDVFNFMPVEKGQYTVQAQVFYGTAYSNLAEETFNAVDASEAVGLSVGYIGFLAVVIAIFIYFKRSVKADNSSNRSNNPDNNKNNRIHNTSNSNNKKHRVINNKKKGSSASKRK